MRFRPALAYIFVLFFFSCEDRVFLDRKPDMIYENGIYVFDPAGYVYDSVLLESAEKKISLRACAESPEPPSLLYNGDGGYFDMFVVSGSDTVYSAQTYLGETAIEALKITVLDVKQGDCIILSPPGEDISVIDGGYGSLGYEDWMGSGEKILLNHLDSLGINNIKYMIETHHDADHYGGLDNVADDYRFAISQHLTNQSVLPSVGDTLFFSSTVKGVLLHYGDLPGETGTEENDRSIAIKMIFGDFEMILTGDIGEDAESVILERDLFDPTEKYEVLKVAHHGSRYSSSAPFLNAVLPVISIISSGAGNDYGHPDPETLEKLSAINSEILRTDQNGTIMIYTNGKSFQIVF